VRGLGLLDRYCPFPFGDGESVLLALDTAGLAECDILAVYEREAIETMAHAIERMPSAPVLVDVGADTGVYSRLLLSRTRRIERLVALEPNPKTYRVLEANLAGLATPCTLLNAAAGEQSGLGTLEAPDYDDAERAMFVRPGPAGNVRLVTVDALLGAQPGCLALKIDVEGAELDVIKGAAESIAAAPRFVVQFEAHALVAKRTGVDPIECLRYIDAIRPVTWAVFEESEARRFGGLTLERGFFAQLPDYPIYDIVVESGSASPEV